MLYAYDIEVLPNFFCVTFAHLKDRQPVTFIISPWQNDYTTMLKFLENVKGMVGFNNLGYDYPVLYPFISSPTTYLNLPSSQLTQQIFKRSKYVLSADYKRDYQYPPLIPQRDLYRIWHFNNKARSTSLKWLQINMDWRDVREIDWDHYHKGVKQEADVKEIVSYNINDVMSTIAFYDRTKDKIIMRQRLGAKYGKDFGNLPDTRIGESIFLSVMSRITGQSEAELRSRRTLRKELRLIEAVPEGVFYTSPEFNKILSTFKELVITNTRSEEEDLASVYFDQMKYDFGFGGLHAFRESGVFKNIVSADVKSYYPSLSIAKKIYPHHLGEAFCKAHEVIKEERKLYPKGSDENEGLKLSGNGVFGQSNAEWSPFYDPLCTMKTTVIGQLLLAQLCEWVTNTNAGRIIMVNTDGIEVEVKNEKRFRKLCELWQKEHKLELDFSKYKVLAVRDVNNYIGVKENGTIKEKGKYVCEPEIFKDQSMRIVRMAVREFFVNGIPVEKTIGDCRDIRLFLMGKRAKTGNLEYRRAESLTELVREKLPKNVRYFISKSGGSIVKVLNKKGREREEEDKLKENQLSLFEGDRGGGRNKKNGMIGGDVRIVNIHRGYRVTLFNKWYDVPFEQYNVDESFYINEAKKLIDPIINKQSEIK